MKLTKCSPKKYDHQIPECIINDKYLTSLYSDGDLELMYVFDKCKALKPLKGIDVNRQQVEFWFKEFLQMGWTKEIFDKQFEAVKRATLYNRIDIENWLHTEMMYSENDFEIAIRRNVDARIRKAELLKKQNIALSDEEKKYIEAAEYTKIKFELNNKRAEVMEKAAIDFRKEYLQNLSGFKKKIAEMTLQQKTSLLDEAIELGKIKIPKKGFEYQAALHNLEDFADLIYGDETFVKK